MFVQDYHKNTNILIIKMTSRFPKQSLNISLKVE